MQLVRGIVVAGITLAGLAACAAEDERGRSWEPEVNAGSGKECAPKTCASLGRKCGKHDDGCGGKVECSGDCVDSACVPKTCEELGRKCGKQDDGCAGTVDCGTCSGCTADPKEPNNGPDRATDLGPMTDSEDATKKVADLSASDDDEDWFKVLVTDGGFMGNPTIKATVSTAASLEVSVFYMCSSATNYSECPVQGEAADTTIGKGCRGKGTASLQTSCSGMDESGIAYVRVKKPAGGAEQCVRYSLDVAVTE